MRAFRICRISLAFFILSGLLAQTAVADEAATIYDPSTVVFVDISLSATEEAKLEAAPDVYVKGTFSMTKSADGTPAGEEPAPFVSARPVEVRLKGSIGGSFRDLTGKAAFKLKFKKADAVLGLRKMTLNNMVQDPSMVHETLAYAAFRGAGVPASRTGFAYVRLNGEDFGVYLNLETLDDIALARMFGAFDDETQHLYEGELGADVFPGGEAGFEIDEGPDDRADLEALIDAVSGEGGSLSWSERVAPHAELIEMTRMWAVEKYIDHWDGYAGHAEAGQQRPNNYYLYSEPSGRFQMLPWGTDQTWIPTIGVGTSGREVTFDGSGGLLFNRCLEDRECFRAYWAALNLATHTIPDLDPATLAEDTANLLLPWQEEERDNGTREEHTAEEVEDGVEESLDFIAGRQVEAEDWLVENEPPSEVVPSTPPSDSAGRGPTLPLPSLHFGHARRDGAALLTRIWLSGPGVVSQRATIETAHGPLRACSVRIDAASGGGRNLRCMLHGSVLHRLRSHGLTLRLRTSFAPRVGDLELTHARVRLARLGDR